MSIVLSLALAASVLLMVSGAASGDPAPRTQVRRGPLATWLERLIEESGATGVRPRDVMLASVGSAALAGLAAHLLLGWPVMAFAAAAVGVALPAWYLAGRRERRRAALQEAIADAVDALRDGVRVGLGLEEALRALAAGGPAPLRATFAAIEHDASRAGLEPSLRRARDEVADPVFDGVVAALLLAYRGGGRNLGAVLDGLGRSVRAQVQVRREVRAEQARNVLSARVIAGLPLVLLVAIRAVSPAYLDAFSTPAGQTVLALCVLSVAAGYALMLRATALPEGRRVRA